MSLSELEMNINSVCEHYISKNESLKRCLDSLHLDEMLRGSSPTLHVCHLPHCHHVVVTMLQRRLDWLTKYVVGFSTFGKGHHSVKKTKQISNPVRNKGGPW